RRLPFRSLLGHRLSIISFRARGLGHPPLGNVSSFSARYPIEAASYQLFLVFQPQDRHEGVLRDLDVPDLLHALLALLLALEQLALAGDVAAVALGRDV